MLFGVARLEEALRLRAAGIAQPILLLEGFFEAADLAIISAQRLHTAVHSPEQLAALEDADLPEPITVWMKLDTGMHRLGVLPEQAEAFYQRLSQCKNVRQPVNIVSHFARADEPECGATERQLDIFTTFAEGKPGCVLSPHPAVYCCGRSRTSTGRVRGLFSTACRRSTVDPPARILAASR
ncbi:alanine racemase [Klebsiella oxytoca]|nr:alanine racemase [Klebsiella oxytoca]